MQAGRKIKIRKKKKKKKEKGNKVSGSPHSNVHRGKSTENKNKIC
jgi:hypothetical protein